MNKPQAGRASTGGDSLPPPGAFYRFMHRLPGLLWPLFGRLETRGVSHVPRTGAFLLLSNHQSVLDPFLIQTCIPRVVHPMAKSTQFASPVVAAVMRRVYAFPVRRFQVDPQAVRVALRRLEAGHPVHVYIEGERSWDGLLQRPRAGTVRLALKAGVPILPCGVRGAYEAWPRWGSGPARAHVTVSFGAPFRLPAAPTKADREAALPEADDRIMSEIARLSGLSVPASLVEADA